MTNSFFEFNDCITVSTLQEHGILRKEETNIILEVEQAGRIIRDKNPGNEVFFFDFDPSQIFPIRNSILEDIGIKILST